MRYIVRRPRKHWTLADNSGELIDLLRVKLSAIRPYCFTVTRERGRNARRIPYAWGFGRYGSGTADVAETILRDVFKRRHPIPRGLRKSFEWDILGGPRGVLKPPPITPTSPIGWKFDGSVVFVLEIDTLRAWIRKVSAWSDLVRFFDGAHVLFAHPECSCSDCKREREGIE